MSRQLLILGIVFSNAVLSPVQSVADSIFDRFAGRWGLAGIYTCEDNPLTIRFSEDRQMMFMSLRKPIKTVLGMEQFFEYEVVGVAGSAAHVRLVGEPRRTEAGEPVTWDVISLDKDRLCWHQTDWDFGECTPPEHRCGSGADAVIELLRSATAQAIHLLSDGGFESASHMFKLPTLLEGEKASRERGRIAKSLRIVIEEFGVPTETVEPNQNPTEGSDIPPLFEVTVSGLQQKVAQDVSEYRPFLFSTNYQRLGPGYFRLQLTDRGDILGMSFALGEDGRERVAAVGERLLREAAP